MDNFESRNEFSDAQDGMENSEEQVTATAGRRDLVLQPDANGVVILPEGASLDNLRAEGRDLVLVLEDGTRIVIPEGAIIVPQIVFDGVTIPAANLAALLTGNEPQPAAGNSQSSGGNFEIDPGAIQDAFDLGDLLPYTQLFFPEPEEKEVIPYNVNEDPTIVVETPDNPVGVINAVATVDEAGLPARTVDGIDETAGTRDETDAETATGTIVFEAPDGVSAVLINGVEITAVGQTFVSDDGTLTITSIDLDSGEIGFSYTLNDNLVDRDVDGFFTMTVVDVDGDSADASLLIRVIDDAPIANDDVDSVDAGTYGPIAGNVMTGDGTDTGAAGADEEGADGASVTGFSGTGGTGSAGDSIDGDYGTLTLEADGSYTYTRFDDAPGGVSDVFEYTLTDADGSTASATLTIEIGNSTPEITRLPSGDAETLVDEAGLPARTGESEGSDEPADSETVAGTISFVSPDGVDSVEINGVVVTGPGQTFDVGEGTLTITGFDPVSGTITYEYTLEDNTSGDDVSYDVDLTVTDLDGDTATGTFTISVTDDVPTANDDSATQDSENAPVTVDVFTNDVQGADSVQLDAIALVDGTLTGAGSVAYNGDGTFTYTPAPGEEGTVTFDYSITDGDGDVSTATVTITLLPDSTPEITIEGADIVYEAGLGARGSEPAGSDEASDSEFTGGIFNLNTGGDTVASLVINGVDVTGGGTVTTARGVLTVTGSGSDYTYTYELTDNTLSDPDSDSFTMVVTDSDGDTDQTTIVITIVDDSPSAEDDANGIAAGEYGPVGGNVLDNDTQGADGATVTSYTGANGSGSAGDTIQGEYGTLTIEADGSYTYTRDAGTEGGVTDTFSYIINDGDGDTATANLVITIADSPVVLDLPVAGGAGTLVDEAGLPAGSDAASDSEFTAGTFTYDADDGPATVTIDGTPVTAVGQTFTGSFGTLTITSIADGVIGYSYELTTNTSGDDTFDSFAVVVTDQDGDSDAGDLEIAIVDDVPTAVADTDSVTEDGPLTAVGNVITDAEANGDAGADTQGADGAIVTGFAFGATDGTVGSSLDGTYGSLVLNADGSYTYTLDNTNPLVQGLDSTESLTEVFTYTITDGDGDPSTTTLTIIINGADDIVTINGLDLQTPELTVDEDDLADGSSPDASALVQSGSFTVDSPDGLSVLTVGGVQVWGGGETYPITITGDYGDVRITAVDVTLDANGDVVAATVSYEYELSDNTLDHSVAGEDSLVDSFDVVATDTDGSNDTASLDIEVIDDVPTALDNENTVGEGAQVSGNVITDDDGFGVDVPGADGPITVVGVTGSTGGDDSAPFVVTTALGTLTVQADGSYTYESFANSTNADTTDTFTYQVVDADGDLSTATLVINIDNVGVEVLDDDATVNEAGLATGSDAASDSEIDADGQITAPGATGTLTFTLLSPATGTYGTLTLDSDTGEYTYTLTSAVDGDSLVPSQGGDNGANTVTGEESFDYEVRDEFGNLVGTGTINVNIIDDVPSIDAASTDGDTVTLTTQDADTVGGTDTDVSTADFGGAFTVASSEYGADGPGSIAWDYSLVVENSASNLSSDGVPIELTLVGGVVEGRANGTLVFTLSVDASTGEVTLTQYEEIDHALPGSSSNYDAQLAVLGDGLVTLSGTATITDGDGDTADETVTLDLGGNVRFADDGPTIDAAVTDGDAVTLTTFDADTVGGTGVDTSTADFGGAFSVASSDYGADGAGSIAWDYSLVIDNATSGLTSDGVPVTLSMNGDVVEGRANGTLVFTVAIDDTTGVVTLTQYEEIDHDLPGSDSNYDSQLEALADGVLSISGTATITDGDGDTAEETVVLDLGGNIRFADDGPTIDAAVTDGDAVTLTTFDADTVGGTGVDTSTADFGGAFSVASSDYGADGAGSIAWEYSLVIDNATSGLTSDGVPVTLSMNGDVVEGRANGTLVFTVAIDDTTGVVTLTQYEEIDHDLPGSDSNYDSQLEALADGVLSISGTATITDGDGDTAEETVVLDLGGNIRFADDGPTIDATVTDGDAVTLTTQDADTVGGTDTDVSTADFGG
ncbi:VCBS domain-containing protein, partial [Qipengyuania aquimaris]|uniref:beta strand repeat-containing protein n=1 Tax=Qipengyuania aquimaris TaxID=255984 RepID=UPI001C976F34